MVNLSRTLGAVVVFTMLAASAQATSITSSGVWNNALPGFTTALTGEGTSTLSWGTSTGYGQSSYNFTGVTDLDVILPTLMGDMLTATIGIFTHNNQPIDGNVLDSVDLDISLGIVNGSIFNGVLSFAFNHFETPNSADPCANGGDNGVGININGCADIITITGGAGGTVLTFWAGSLQYQIDLFFSGGLTSFETMESASNSQDLEAKFTVIAIRVPEPATFALFAFGLLGLGFMIRRRNPAA